MKNNYIEIPLNANNEFRVTANITIPSINIIGSNDVIVKIDTGCPHTSFPVQKLGLSKEYAQYYKQRDMNDDSISKFLSFGINDSMEKREEDKRLFKSNQYMQLKSVTFCHTDVRIQIQGMKISNVNARLSYDRTSNILIGMDILKDWDIHIRTILNKDLEEYGETIFLGCPMNQINNQYLIELERLFGLSMAVK